jgi:hypothetical protein
MGPIVTRTRCQSNSEDHQGERQVAVLPKITADFAGSFELKYRRVKARMKVWILILTCLIVQTIHFEVTDKFDTKFCDDQGIPEILTSDKQTSLHKADKEIRDRYASMDWDRITEEQRMDLHTQLRHQTTVQQHVWSRFQRAILPLISQEKKKSVDLETFGENDYAVKVDDNLSREVWRLLRVIQLMSSTDGNVQPIEILSSVGKTYVKPISKPFLIVRRWLFQKKKKKAHLRAPLVPLFEPNAHLLI